MDNIFEELIGKPVINAYGRIITVVAENFTFIDDQARFLKATFAIPENKHLQLTGKSRRLIQIGSLHRDIKTQLENENWSIQDCKPPLSNELCDRIGKELLQQSKSIIFINDASRWTLSCQTIQQIKQQSKRFIRLVLDLKREHFVVVLYQSSVPKPAGTFLRDLEYVSDACIKTKRFSECYFQSIWYQPHMNHAKNGSLLPSKVVTQYVTCKIGVSYWSPKLLQFYERREVNKDYDPESDFKADKSVAKRSSESGDEEEEEEDTDEAGGSRAALRKLNLFDTDEADNTSTLPYLRAQNPEQSRIFYYPDKEDDIDEDDPDNDLDI